MNHFLWKIIFTLIIINAFSHSDKFPQNQQCVGKHQMPFEDFTDFELANELTEPIALENFNVTPVETILVNNDYTLVVNMKYSHTADVPTITFDAAADLDTYRFEFLYFQWFENAKLDLPFELHLVFYNTKKKTFEHALRQKNMIVILAFGFKVKQPPTTTISQFNVLAKNVKSIRTGGHKVAIENCPLNGWLPKTMNGFFMYEGRMPFYDCQPQVLWVDVDNAIVLEVDLLKEFEVLQTRSGQALMKQFKPFLRPSSELVVNYGNESSGNFFSDSVMLVDAYNFYNDYGEPIAFNKSFQAYGNIRNFLLFISGLQFISLRIYISQSF